MVAHFERRVGNVAELSLCSVSPANSGIGKEPHQAPWIAASGTSNWHYLKGIAAYNLLLPSAYIHHCRCPIAELTAPG